MRKITLLLAVFLLVVCSFGMGEAAKAIGSDGYDSTLILENKNPGDWSVIHDWTFGNLRYNAEGETFQYRISARGLKPRTDYSLIYYADPWPGDNLGAVLGTFKTNWFGWLYRTGESDLSMSLPVETDENYPDGAKIWLLPTSHLTEGDLPEMPLDTWNPEDILFETKLITYTYVEPEPEPEPEPVYYRDPNQLDVVLKWGFGWTTYYPETSNLKYGVTAVGRYNDTLYRLDIPACELSEKVAILFITDIDVIAGELHFALGKNIAFSQPCTVYKASGKFYTDNKGKWWGGEWIPVGTFSEVVYGVAKLE